MRLAANPHPNGRWIAQQLAVQSGCLAKGRLKRVGAGPTNRSGTGKPVN